MFYLLLSFAAVMGVKFYTSMSMGALEKRLREVQRALDRVKVQRKEVENEQNSMLDEEQSCEDRIRSMKEIIEDLEYRLTISQQEETEVILRRRPSIRDRRRGMSFQGEDVNVAVPCRLALEDFCNVLCARMTGLAFV